MGSKVASDIFQRMLDSVYIGLPGVTGIADDMVIFGRNEEEHDRNLILFSRNHQKEWTCSQQEKTSIQEGRSQFLRSQMEFYRNLPRSKED